MPSIKAQLELMRSIGLSTDEARAGIAKLAWPQNLRRRQGLAIGELQKDNPVHPKRLLAELADEFDRGIEI
jgi:hypothetical protein